MKKEDLHKTNTQKKFRPFLGVVRGRQEVAKESGGRVRDLHPDGLGPEQNRPHASVRRFTVSCLSFKIFIIKLSCVSFKISIITVSLP